MKKPLSAAEAKAQLDYQGISIAQWCRERKYPYSLTVEILAGKKRCLRGTSHNIAVALGIKNGVPTTRPGRVAPDRAAAMGAAA